ncbi:MAG: oxidoreductase [Deltaproteobacteria bacterium]|nr:MAG: oxidoreductase [Deltaproteobacteria bacterium]
MGAIMSQGEAPQASHRRVVVSRHGGPEVLEVVEEPLPTPAPGEARVRVRAAGVSSYDLMQRRSGALPGTPRVPFTPGLDVVGEVDAVGDGVTSLAVGQRVAGGSFTRDGGGYAEHLCMPAWELVAVPPGVDDAEAVCLVVNYLTAHLMMHRVAAVRRGERALVHGAAGGVGTALLELGGLAGLTLLGTASAAGHDVVARLGATPIDYRDEDFVERARAVTGEGVDVVFDPIGGWRQLWRSHRALRRGGRLVWFGVAAAPRDGLRVIPASLAMHTLLRLLPDGRRALASDHLGKFSLRHRPWYRETLAELLGLLAAGALHPVVAARVPLAEAARAHALLERGGHAGKVVLVSGGAAG